MTYVQPLLLLCAIISLAGLVRLRRCPRWRLTALGLGAFMLVSWPPMDWLLSRPLESWYAVQPVPAAPAQAIVVLAAGVDPPSFERPYPLPDRETYNRCEHAAWLHKHWQPLPVLACGGPGPDGFEAFAVTMRELLVRAGVPETHVWTEERSHSTHENAVYAAKILREHAIANIALVVDAKSMPRAQACFRHEGILVVPAPSAFRRPGGLSDEALPSWKAVFRNEMTLHESLGLIWYALHGWLQLGAGSRQK